MKYFGQKYFSADYFKTINLDNVLIVETRGGDAKITKRLKKKDHELMLFIKAFLVCRS